MSRIPCIVPFCRRTADAAKFPGCEIICGKHWRMVSKQTRHRRRLADRAFARAGQRFNQRCIDRGVAQWTPSEWTCVERARRLSNALWERCKREAIERAGGIS